MAALTNAVKLPGMVPT